MVNTNLDEEQQYMNQLTNTVDDYKRKSSRLDSLNRLMKNDDFINLIYEGLFGDIAKEVFEEMTTPKSYASIEKDDCEQSLEAITFLKAYLGYESPTGYQEGKVHIDGKIAKDSLPLLLKEMKG